MSNTLPYFNHRTQQSNYWGPDSRQSTLPRNFGAMKNYHHYHRSSLNQFNSTNDSKKFSRLAKVCHSLLEPVKQKRRQIGRKLSKLSSSSSLNSHSKSSPSKPITFSSISLCGNYFDTPSPVTPDFDDDLDDQHRKIPLLQSQQPSFHIGADDSVTESDDADEHFDGSEYKEYRYDFAEYRKSISISSSSSMSDGSDCVDRQSV